MTTELENTLARELHEVADGVQVPPMPELQPDADPRSRGHVWQPLLVAASVAVIVGVAALMLSRHDAGTPQPTPSPSPPAATATDGSDRTIADTTPKVPYVIDQRLYVEGTQVPGTWWLVESRAGTWVGQRTDGSWWWGAPGVDAMEIDAQIDQSPVISPHGGQVAFVDTSSGRASVNGFTTEPDGEGFGISPIADLPATEDGIPVRVRAVTDDGDVIVQGTRTSLMWRTQQPDQDVVDLSETAPDQVVLQGTAAGLVVVDGSGGATDATDTEPYLATVAADGTLDRVGSLPTYDALDVNQEGTWLVRSPAGTLAGEVTSVSSLRAQPVTGGDEVTLHAPQGWGFANGTWTWEDEVDFLTVLLPAEGGDQAVARPARCNVTLAACRALPVPAIGATAVAAASSAEEVLDLVVQAAADRDRGALADPGVIAVGDWDQLVGYAAGRGGSVASCRDNGGGTKDCEIDFAADPATNYYAIVEPADNRYGWRITYVGIGGA